MSGETGPLLGEVAAEVRERSIARWGAQQAIEMVGRSPVFLRFQTTLSKASRYREPVLISGESGVGKELIAQAVYLLGHPKGCPFVPVNCPQLQGDGVTASALFGHSRGSFTGAIADHKGAFEQAHGGVIFLDEIADMHPAAQAMLLRAISTGEINPVGSERRRTADVQVVSATNKPLNALVLSGQFRFDLFFRLRQFHLEVPPLRERGNDWRLIADRQLQRLAQKYGVARRFSPPALKLLDEYDWPGNVRELDALTRSGYMMADGPLVEPAHVRHSLEGAAMQRPSADPLYERIVGGHADFWTDVYEPFMDRTLNRAQVRDFLARGFEDARHNYRRLVDVLHLAPGEYDRFMSFLRHHDLKPTSAVGEWAPRAGAAAPDATCAENGLER